MDILDYNACLSKVHWIGSWEKADYSRSFIWYVKNALQHNPGNYEGVDSQMDSLSTFPKSISFLSRKACFSVKPLDRIRLGERWRLKIRLKKLIRQDFRQISIPLSEPFSSIINLDRVSECQRKMASGVVAKDSARGIAWCKYQRMLVETHDR